MTSPSLSPRDESIASGDGPSLWHLMGSLSRHWLLLAVVPIVVAALAFFIVTLLPKTYTARTSLLIPQQQGSGAAALASLGALSGLAGAAAGLRNPSDQYVSLLQSHSVLDAVLKRFDLLRIYDVSHMELARRELRERSRVLLGRKDNLILIEVDDNESNRAAEMANAYVEELRNLMNRLAITEAQQRRVFFEGQLSQTRERLLKAQISLQAAGFSEGNLRAEPKAAAEGYSRLRAEITATEVRLGVLRRSMTDNAPEVISQTSALQSLRSELARLEASSNRSSSGLDYIDRYREFKYQESLFELFSKQFELARVDESREGGIIQVVDVATPPELHSKPKRSLVTIGSALLTLVALIGILISRNFIRLHSSKDVSA